MTSRIMRPTVWVLLLTCLIGLSSNPAHAFYNRGTMQMTLGAASVSVPVGGSVAISAVITPFSYTGLPGCGKPECPQDKSCMDGNGKPLDCGDEVNGQCACAGTVPTTTFARAVIGVSDSFIASAEYSGGSIIVTGKSTGTTTITVRAILKEFMDSPTQTITVTVNHIVQPSISPPDIPQWTPPAATPPQAVQLPSLPPSMPGGGASGGGQNGPNLPVIPSPAVNGGSNPDNLPSVPPLPTPALQSPAVMPSWGSTSIPSPSRNADTGANTPQAPYPPMISLSPSATPAIAPSAAPETGTLPPGSGSSSIPGNSQGNGTAGGSGQAVGGGSAGQNGNEADLDAITPHGAEAARKSAAPDQADSQQAGDTQANQEQGKEITGQEGPTIIVELTGSGPTGKAEMEQAKRENGRVIFQKLDESNKVVYSWIFKGADLIAPADIDMGITILDALPDNREKSDDLINPAYLSFAHQGALPGKAEIYVRADNRYSPQQILTLYNQKPGSKEWTAAGNDLPLKSGYVSFELSDTAGIHALAEGKAESISRQTAIVLSVALAIVAAGFILTAIIITTRRKRRLNLDDQSAAEPVRRQEEYVSGEKSDE